MRVPINSLPAVTNTETLPRVTTDGNGLANKRHSAISGLAERGGSLRTSRSRSRPKSIASPEAYRGLGVTLVGDDVEYIAGSLARGGLSELSLASTDLLAPAFLPLANCQPRRDWVAERNRIARTAERTNSQLSITSYSHGVDVIGAHWLRCAATRSDVIVHLGNYDATARLLNRISFEQVKPAVYAEYDALLAIGQICVVVPRGSGLQYRGSFQPTLCWACSASPLYTETGEEESPVPTWFKRLVTEYVDALLLPDGNSVVARRLANGRNCVRYISRRNMGIQLPAPRDRSCDVCGYGYRTQAAASRNTTMSRNRFQQRLTGSAGLPAGIDATKRTDFFK